MKIGLLWHSFYSGNLGVSALTDANMSIISKASHGQPIEFVIFGPKGDTSFRAPTEYADAEYIEVSSVKNAWAIRKKLQSCDIVFDIGAGDSFSDIYGWKRFIKVTGLKLLSRSAGRPVVLSPQTLGPFKSPLARQLALLALRSCQKIFARDQLSFERVEQISGGALEGKMDLTTDVAFALPRLEKWPDNFPTLDPNKTHIGINVSGLMYQGGYNGTNQFNLSLDYPQLIKTLLEELPKNKDYKVWLIPHVYQISRPALEGDRTVSEKLVEEFAEVSIAPLFLQAREAKTFIAGMDLVLAARMHAAIGAVSSGVACLPMSYSIKFQGLFNSIGYHQTLDMKSVDTDVALDTVRNAITKIPEMKAAAKDASQRAQEKLDNYRTYVGELINMDRS